MNLDYLLSKLRYSTLWGEDQVQVAATTLGLEVDLLGGGQGQYLGQLLEDGTQWCDDHTEGERGRAVVDHGNRPLDRLANAQGAKVDQLVLGVGHLHSHLGSLSQDLHLWVFKNLNKELVSLNSRKRSQTKVININTIGSFLQKLIIQIQPTPNMRLTCF